MKKIILAVACTGVMGSCFADDITIRICDSKNRRECTFGTYGDAAVQLAERDAIAKMNGQEPETLKNCKRYVKDGAHITECGDPTGVGVLPTTIDTTEEKSDFEIKEEKPSVEEKVSRGASSFLHGGLAGVVLSFVGKD